MSAVRCVTQSISAMLTSARGQFIITFSWIREPELLCAGRPNKIFCMHHAHVTMTCATHVSANVFAFIAYIYWIELVSPSFKRNEKYVPFRTLTFFPYERMSYLIERWYGYMKRWNAVWRRISQFSMERAQKNRYPFYHAQHSTVSSRTKETQTNVVNFLIFSQLGSSERIPEHSSRKAHASRWTHMKPFWIVKPMPHKITITNNGNEYPKPIQLSNKISYQFFIVYARTTIIIQCVGTKIDGRDFSRSLVPLHAMEVNVCSVCITMNETCLCLFQSGRNSHIWKY